MARGMADGEVKARQRDGLAVFQCQDVSRLAEGHAAEELLPGHEVDALARVGEQRPVVRVDVGGDALRPADRRDRPHVIYVTVSEQHRDRLQPVTVEEFLDPPLRVLPRVDDHALLARRRRHQVAVGGEGTCGKASH